MVKLYWNHRATGEEVETAAEMRKQGYSTTEKDFIGSINDLDNRISRNEVSLEDFDTCDDGNEDSNNFSTQDMR